MLFSSNLCDNCKDFRTYDPTQLLKQEEMMLEFYLAAQKIMFYFMLYIKFKVASTAKCLRMK